jgi:hypothetical protein
MGNNRTGKPVYRMNNREFMENVIDLDQGQDKFVWSWKKVVIILFIVGVLASFFVIAGTQGRAKYGEPVNPDPAMYYSMYNAAHPEAQSAADYVAAQASAAAVE